MATRRTVLAGLLATTLPGTGWAGAGSPAFLAAAADAEGTCWLHGISASGESVFHLPLPARGHAAAAHPTRPEAVAFARRPGTFALVFDCAAGTTLARLAPPEGRQFNGHGAFSADGSVLFTSEVVAEGSEGRLGLWDAAGGYRRMREVPTHGIGPHDLRRMPDGGLVVANGGIRTDPQDRRKLNTDTMEPSLVYLAPDGVLRERVVLDPALHRNSIRHLALAPDGTVAFAMQWEGDPAEPVPLLGLHRQGGRPRLCAPDPAQALAMKGYAGSIAMSRDGTLIALTSSKGGVVMVFGSDGGQRAVHRRQDVSGVAALGSGFVVTDGLGGVGACDETGFRLLSQAGFAWDNHLVPLS